MIVISDFTEPKSDPRSGGISAADFGASKFCSHIDAAPELVAVWSDENSGEELNFKIYDFDRELKFSLRGRSSTRNSNPARLKFGWRVAMARGKFRY